MYNKHEKYIKLLAQKYPSEQAVCREIINLNAILNLPKGTEHFMSDIHGEYEAFCHILNNCSGVIKEKVDLLFKDKISDIERREICTMIYYPREKLSIIKNENKNSPDWYRNTLYQLIEIAKFLSSKYTRSKVRKAMPMEFSYIIDELLHAQQDEDDNRVMYHEKIVDTIISIKSADNFIVEISNLIKRLAVDHLHIVGDIFDRGSSADKIVDMLMKYHSLDVEWGNHDILWMGACAGSKACIATVVYNNLKSGNIEILESGYGISLRELYLFGENVYPSDSVMKSALKAISVILFKLEGQIIDRHPEYEMDGRRLLDKIDFKANNICIDGKVYELGDSFFPTVEQGREYELSEDEQAIIDGLKNAFVTGERLNKHIDFLYRNGSMYRIFNDNLMYHGCVPLDENGNFKGIKLGEKIYEGKNYLDYADRTARHAYYGDGKQDDLDFMWYLWCGKNSPLSGRNVRTFERAFVKDESAWIEEVNPYFKLYYSEKVCDMILHEFGLYSEISHIINGHTPVKTACGEQPVRANGKLIVIDGGFCEKYHKTTGIAGYTLIFNSHGMRIKAHQPFESVQKALSENKDIESSSDAFETEKFRLKVKNTDAGKRILSDLDDFEKLLEYYRNGII